PYGRRRGRSLEPFESRRLCCRDGGRAQTHWQSANGTTARPPQRVDALLGQRERRLQVEREAARATTDVRRAQALTRLAVIGCALFLAVLCAMVELSADTVP